MAFPLVHFVAGAVVGGLTAYFLRDEKLKGELRRSAGELTDRVKRGAEKVSDEVAERFEGFRRDGRDGDKQETPRKAEVVETRKTKKKKVTARKKTARKKAARKAPMDSEAAATPGRKKTGRKRPAGKKTSGSAGESEET